MQCAWVPPSEYRYTVLSISGSTAFLQKLLIYFSFIITTFDYIWYEPLQASLNKEEEIKKYSLFCYEACFVNEAQLQCNFCDRSLYNANFRVVVLTAACLGRTLWRYYAITPFFFCYAISYNVDSHKNVLQQNWLYSLFKSVHYQCGIFVTTQNNWTRINLSGHFVGDLDLSWRMCVIRTHTDVLFILPWVGVSNFSWKYQFSAIAKQFPNSCRAHWPGQVWYIIRHENQKERLVGYHTGGLRLCRNICREVHNLGIWMDSNRWHTADYRMCLKT